MVSRPLNDLQTFSDASRFVQIVWIVW